MKNKCIEFLRGERLADFFKDFFEDSESPFQKKNFPSRFLCGLGEKFAEALENALDGQLYIKKLSSPLEKIPPRFNKLIWRLKDDGILEKILFPEPIPGWPKVPAINLRFSRQQIASGYALDYNTASIKALAELLEWQAFAKPDKRGFITGKWDELKLMGAVDPRDFVSFSKKQLAGPEHASYRIVNDAKLSWVKCFSIFDGKKYFVPAQLAYYGYEFLPQEPLIRKSTSNGGAAGTSAVMALVRGLLEAIERDALMIHWLNEITPPRIDIDSLEIFGNETIAGIISEYRKYKIDFALLDITTDLKVPVMLTVIRDRTLGRPAVFLGAGADLDVEAAIIHSLLEGLRAGYWAAVSEEQIATVNKKAPLIENIEERRFFWCDKSRISGANFLFSGPIKKMTKNEHRGAGYQAKFERLRKILKANNINVYGVDCTSKVADEFGLKIMMVLVPELYYLYLNERFKYLGTKRLYEAPVRMGVLKQPKKEEEINLTPHPFL